MSLPSGETSRLEEPTAETTLAGRRRGEAWRYALAGSAATVFIAVMGVAMTVVVMKASASPREVSRIVSSPPAVCPPVPEQPAPKAAEVAPPPAAPEPALTPPSAPPAVRASITPRPGSVRASTNGANGALTVVCTPKCDQIVDNGEPLGPGHIFNRPVSSGRHTLLLSAPNGVKKTVPVEVFAEVTREVRISMERPGDLARGTSGHPACDAPPWTDESGVKHYSPACLGNPY
jgi:hypothetical protein